MKQKFLLKTMLLLCAIVGGVNSAWATLPQNPQWVATSLSNISDNATIIILSNSDIALPSTTTNTNPSKKACEKSTSNGITTIKPPTGTSLQDLAWTLKKVTENNSTSYKFYQEGSTTVRLYLNGTNSNTALRVGDTNSSDDQFVLGGFGKLLKVTTATRYVGPYNSGSDWRTYNTENAPNYNSASLTFYVLQTSTPTPTISAEPTTLNTFTYVEGSDPSAAQTISVSGANLTENISLALDENSNYEMCLTENGTYTNSLTLTQSDGTVSATNVYVRLKSGLAKGTHNGTLTISSSGTENISISLNGSVTGQAHVVTVATGLTGGTIGANPTSAVEGATISLTATPDAAYTFGSWSVYKTGDQSTTVNVENNQFTMPDYAVTVTATFNAKPTHTATFSVNGNTTSNTFYEGQTITFPANLDDEFDKKFMGWVSEAIDGTTDDEPEFVTSATMGNNDVTYYAVFAEESTESSVVEKNLTISNSDLTTALSGSYGSASINKTIDETQYTINIFACKQNSQCQLRASDSYIQIPTLPGNITNVSTTACNNAGTGTYTGTIRLKSAFAAGNTTTNDILTKDLSSVSLFSIDVTGNVRAFYLITSAGLRLSDLTVTYEVTGETTVYSNYCTTVAAPVAVTDVTLNKNSATLEVGDTETLTATIAPNDATNKNVTWTSSNTSIATVENGIVTAVGVGSATITVTSVADNTKTATCSVTVNPTAVTGVSIDETATVKMGKTVTLSATVSPDNATNKNVTWTSSNTAVATVSDAGVVTGVAAGEATITVTSVSDNTKYASCTVTVLTAGTGTKANPYDVDEALEIINAYSNNSGSDVSVYTKGIVSSVGTMYNSTMLTYFISVDGENTNTVQVFRGKNINNTNFSAITDLSVGDEVIVYGQLYKYVKNSTITPEINTGNYIYSHNGVKIPEITFGAASYEVAYNGSLTITATADCSGVITYTSSDTDIAEINSTTGVVTPHTSGEVTITANIAASVDNIAGSKEVTLTVTDGRDPAGIAFGDATITKTWGESFTGQELTNLNSLTVSYASSVPAVATVDGNGAVSVLKAGTTVITATFAGNEDYMPAEVSYTLTVNKAAAGLSFNETEFDIELGDDSFVAPTLNNPNSLTVTWESSDEEVAVMDENGTLMYEESAVGTATITASFAGNDWYEEGSASYTINIYDPNAKGTKQNPYTVSEVIDGTATGSDIYVTGYIVGEFVGKTSNPRTSGFTGNSNLTLADVFTSSPAVANCIPIELPSSPSSLRNNWGLSNNPTLVGYKVLLKGNAQPYFSVNGIKGTSEITAVSVPVTFGTNGYTTFANRNPLDLTTVNLPEGVIAYKAAVSGTTVIFTALNQTVPANTGVLLKGEASATVSIPVAESGTDVTENAFLVNADGTTFTGDDDYYYFAMIKNSLTFGVFNPNTLAFPANKAYLKVLKSSLEGPNPASRLMVVFNDGETTGIKSMDNGHFLNESSGIAERTIDNAVYDLQGRRVETPRKGSLYIVNGKKVVF